MKIAFFEVDTWEKDYLVKNLEGQLTFSEDETNESNLPEKETQVLSCFVGSKITREVFEKLPKLKLISTRTTGFDHIDLVEAKKRSVTVTNVPTYGENTVAEYAFALMLALSRKIVQANIRIRNLGDFSFEGLSGFDLKGKTLGVIGTGHIGARVIKIAKGFEMNVVAHDPFPNKELASKLNFPYASLEEVLSKADILTLHAPYNKKTHHLINKSNILNIKKGAYIINTARGGLIETDALVGALQNNHLGGAALDVLELEQGLADEGAFLKEKYLRIPELKTLLEDHILMEMPNVIVTPHNAFNTREAVTRILDTTITNIKSFSEGTPTNTVSQK